MKRDGNDEPTCRCHQNPFIGALGIFVPKILVPGCYIPRIEAKEKE